MFALTFSATEALRTAPVATALFPGLSETPWGEMAGRLIIVTAPIALLAFVFQRQVVTGLTAGSAKG